MKIDVISDLHLTKIDDSIEVEPQGDLIVIAGDVSSSADVVINFLNSLSGKYRAVIYTFGNIELWHDNNPYEKLKWIKENTNDNVFILDFLKGIKISNLIITGGIYISPENLTNHDRENIVNTDEFIKNLSNLSRTSIHKQIKELNPKIIVTHYPPVSISNLKKLSNTNEIKFSKIWVFGHYHQFKSFIGTHPIVKDILYVSNASNKIMTLEI
ncbi:metallophosphoesterase family protein [Desulfurobacterium sp.]